MNVSTATSAAAAPQPTNQSSTTQSASDISVDYDTFLKLLVAQLKNQDPSEPMDPAQYVAQLATFSNVEQAIKMNSKLDSLMTATALSQADGLIGRTLTSADGTVSGKVKSIQAVSGGAVAILENGKKIDLTSGVTVT